MVRAASPDDVDELARLYAGLSEDDLYHRFFQAHVPPRHTLERAAGASGRGDLMLIAETSPLEAAHPTRPTVVAEASYARLADGDGELGIAVDRPARGWLGPYLLSVLCEEAAARGIANLQADILLDNDRMLALVRHRGYATIGHSSTPAIVRVVFSTVDVVPSWPRRRTRPRLVVEAPGARWHAESAARAAGFEVLVCPGPQSPWSRCPAVRGQPCPLAGGADLVVDALGSVPGQDPGMEALHRRLHPNTCLYVEPSTDGPGGGPSGAASAEGPLMAALETRLAEFCPGQPPSPAT